MSLIRIRVDEVKSINTKIRHKSSNLSYIKQGLTHIKNDIDSSIMNKKSMINSFNNALNEINHLEIKLINLVGFLNNSMDIYSRADNNISRKTKGISKVDLLGLTPAKIKGILFNDSIYSNMSTGLDLYRLTGYLKKGINFDTFEKDGKIFIKIVDDKILKKFIGNIKTRDYARLLKKELSLDSINFAEKLTNEGIPLYDKHTNSLISKNVNKFKNINFEDLKDYITDIGNEGKPFKKFRGKFGETFLDEIDLIKKLDPQEWKEISKISKIGKGVGIAGTIMTAYGDIEDNFYNKDLKKWEISGDSTRDFVLDFGIDLGAGGAATATGAAIGSFFVPPVGTVIGISVGLAINYLISDPLITDENGEKISLIDATKHNSRHIVDKMEEMQSKTVDYMGPQGAMLTIYW